MNVLSLTNFTNERMVTSMARTKRMVTNMTWTKRMMSNMSRTMLVKTILTMSLEFRKGSEEVACDTTLVRIAEELCIEVLVSVQC